MANRSVIRFNANSPVTLQLDRIDGKETRSQINDQIQWMYSVNGGQAVIYLNSSAKAALERTHAQPGDMVKITKSVDGQSISWRVEVLADQTQSAQVQERAAQRPAPQPINHGAAALVPAVAPQIAAQSHMAQCLFLAIDAAKQAEEYARGKNFSVTFLGSDIRAMANSLMIQDGGRR